MAGAKNFDMLPISAKITASQLNWTNYSDWNKTVRMYILGIEMETHLSEDPPSGDETKLLAWQRADVQILFQIQNSIEPRILSSVSHCNTVKEIMSYLEVMFSDNRNITQVHEVYKGFYRSQQQGRPLKDFFLDFKRMYEEMKILMSPKADLSTRIKNLELQAILSFLEALDPSYETIRCQILSSQELPSLEDVFSRVLHADSLIRSSIDPNASDLVGRDPFENRNYGYKPSTSSLPINLGSIICNYCKEFGHIKKNCRKLQNKRQRDQQRGLAHIAQTHGPSDFGFSSAGALATGTLSSGLITTSTKWVIDFGATDHMIGSFEEAEYW